MSPAELKRADLHRNFGFLIHDVARLMRVAFDRRGKELGLTRSQWWVLTALYAREGVTQSELSDFMDLEKATLGRLLDRLEIERVNYVGISMGGMIGQIFTLAYPERVRSLSLCMTTSVVPSDTPPGDDPAYAEPSPSAYDPPRAKNDSIARHLQDALAAALRENERLDGDLKAALAEVERYRRRFGPLPP